MGTLRKEEIAAVVAKRLDVSEAKGKEALDAVLDSIQESLAAGDAVAIPSFGRFDVKDVAARRVRSIRGGVPITVAAHKRVRFKPGTPMKAAADTQWAGRMVNRAKRFLSGR